MRPSSISQPASPVCRHWICMMDFFGQHRDLAWTAFSSLTLPLTATSGADARVRGLAGSDRGWKWLEPGPPSVVGSCYRSMPGSCSHTSPQRSKADPRIALRRGGSYRRPGDDVCGFHPVCCNSRGLHLRGPAQGVTLPGASCSDGRRPAIHRRWEICGCLFPMPDDREEVMKVAACQCETRHHLGPGRLVAGLPSRPGLGCADGVQPETRRGVGLRGLGA